MRARRVLALAAAGAALSGALAGAASAQEVEARLDRRAIVVGETSALIVSVRGGAASGEPRFDVPEGVEVLSSSRSQSFSWVNGKMSNETTFRYELGANAPGSYRIGPIDVKVGGRVYRSGLLALEVTAAPQRIGGGAASGPASLSVDVIPHDPWVGQPVVLRVRLVQRVPFAEDPAYTPPSTTGFWIDKPGAPESFYADEGSERVLVTETRTRMYPVAAGIAQVGEATATVSPAGDQGLFGWMGRGGREIVIRSHPITVRVRPLPPGEPESFTGGVGSFQVDWSADRPSTARDVPVTLRLDVRGTGNLPLIRPPRFADRDLEIFAATTDDSLPAPGGDVGRKRFLWTVLPRRQGTVVVEPPEVAWFDPATASYRRARPPAVTIEVGPPLFAGTGTVEGFPPLFSEHPLEPRARGPVPWAWALGGLGLGAGFALWRAAGRRGDPAAATRAAQLEGLRAIGTGHGPDFWHAADAASSWLEARGTNVRDVRERIATARYAGEAAGDEEMVRRRLVEQLSRALPPPPPRTALRVGGVALMIVSIAWCALFGPRAADPRAARIAQQADQAARRGDLEHARATWASLWRSGVRDPGLAARLAWSELQSGAVGPAALWVLRGELAEARDPALEWTTDRVREAGGLVGGNPPRWPVTRLEWSLAALLLGAVAGALWPRRRVTVALAAAALVLGTIHPLQGWLALRSGTAVVLETTPLEGGGLELQAGQVVEVRTRSRDRVRVAAGRVVSGWLPARAVGVLEGSPS